MSSPEFGSVPADPSANPTPPDGESAPARRFRSRKGAKATQSTPAQAVSVQPAQYAPAAEAPLITPIQPLPETFYSQEVIQQPTLASRTAYLHTAPPNYPAATPYQPSPAHAAAPSYVSQTATQTWPAIENTLPRDEQPSLTEEEAAAVIAAAAAAKARGKFRMPKQRSFKLSMPRIRMPKVRLPKVRVPSMKQVRQSIPQIKTKKVAWKRIGVVSAALLALMLTIPTIYVMADRAPDVAAVQEPETSTLKTLRDKVWNLVTLGRGGVKNDQDLSVVALSLTPPVPQNTDALLAAVTASIAAADARLASGQPVLLGIDPGTVVRPVALKPLVAGEPIYAAQRTLDSSVSLEQVAMSAQVTNVEAVPLAPVCRVTHTVRRGEGLFTIADAYGVERRDVYRANTWVRNRPNMYLYVGDEVCIP